MAFKYKNINKNFRNFKYIFKIRNKVKEYFY